MSKSVPTGAEQAQEEKAPLIDSAAVGNGLN